MILIQSEPRTFSIAARLSTKVGPAAGTLSLDWSSALRQSRLKITAFGCRIPSADFCGAQGEIPDLEDC